MYICFIFYTNNKHTYLFIAGAKLVLSGIYEPWHEIYNNVALATSKASDQPAHMRSLIIAFSSRLNILRLLSY